MRSSTTSKNPNNMKNLHRPLSELEKIAKGIAELALIHRDVFLKGEIDVSYTDEATGLHLNAILNLHDLDPFMSKDELFNNIIERAGDSQVRIYTERNGKAMLIIDYCYIFGTLLARSIVDRFKKSCTKLPFIKSSIALWGNLEKKEWCAEMDGNCILLSRKDEEFLIDCDTMTFSDLRLKKEKEEEEKVEQLKKEKEEKVEQLKKELESLGYRLTLERL